MVPHPGSQGEPVFEWVPDQSETHPWETFLLLAGACKWKGSLQAYFCLGESKSTEREGGRPRSQQKG